MTGILNIQIKPTAGKVDINLKKAEHFMKKYSENNLDLVVLPAFFLTGIEEMTMNTKDFNPIDAICKLAKKYNTNIVAGSIIENSYNTSFVINREGQIVEKYNAIHLNNFLGSNENEILTSGDCPKVVDLDFGKIGLAINYDLRFPLHFHNLSQMGAEIIVIPSAWLVPTEIYQDKRALKYAQEMWIALNRTRAYDNMAYVVSSNQSGIINDNISALGSSMIISPTAEVLDMAVDEQCAIYAEIEIDSVKYLRNLYPMK